MVEISIHGDSSALTLAYFLPLTRVKVQDVVLGDIVVGDKTCALVASIERDGESICLLDVCGNGDRYPHLLDWTTTIIDRAVLVGTPEQRIAHAQGEAWLPRDAKRGQ